MQYFGYQDLVPELRKFGAPILQSVENFLAAKQEGVPPERKDKPCGVDGSGVVCQMQIDLRMRHYQLTPNMDPILIYQQFEDFLWLNTIARHQDIFQGRERRWCYDWQNAIYWDGNEAHLDQLIAEFENA
jgi:hypothetical protein